MTAQHIGPAPAGSKNSGRRTFLGHVAGISAAIGLVYGCAKRTPVDPDAELLTRVAEFARLDRQLTEEYFAGLAAIDMLGLTHAEGVRAKNAYVKSLTPTDKEIDAMLLAIAALPAATPAGLAAKGRLIQRWVTDGWDEHHKMGSYRNPWERVACSLGRDLVMAGGLA